MKRFFNVVLVFGIIATLFSTDVLSEELFSKPKRDGNIVSVKFQKYLSRAYKKYDPEAQGNVMVAGFSQASKVAKKGDFLRVYWEDYDGRWMATCSYELFIKAAIEGTDEAVDAYANELEINMIID